MKKMIVKLIVLGLSMVIFQGCTEISVDTGEAIDSPRNKFIPIKGTWRVEGVKKIKETEDEEIFTNSLVGKQAAFDENVALLGNEVCENPEYKIRSVRAKDYFLYTYQIPYKNIGPMEPMVEIVSITANGQHFYDVILIDDQQLVVHKENAFFYLKHTSSDVNSRLIDRIRERSMGNHSEIPAVEPSLLRSGVLLGLRAPVSDDSDSLEQGWKGEEMTYRTLWIGAKNRQMYSIEEVENLLVPRKSGFWIVGFERKIEGAYSQDYFTANSLEAGSERSKKISSLLPQRNEDSRGAEYEKEESIFPRNLFKRIRFIGNDYAAIEYSESWKDKENPKNYFQLMPIDNINNGKGINISDVAGEEGQNILLNSAQGYLSNLNGSEISRIEDQVQEDYFTLERRNGHWLMKGRLYYSEHQEESYLEYSINMIPPTKIVNYDELHVSWSKIKDKVPEAIDAFISPNKDIAVIITENFIHIYGLTKGELEGKPLEKIKLLEGEVVVMAEWATGHYVEKWKNFIKEDIRSKP